MKLRSQSFLLISAAFVGATFLMWVGVRSVALREIERVDKSHALETAARAKLLMLDEQAELGRWADFSAQQWSGANQPPGMPPSAIERVGLGRETLTPPPRHFFAVLGPDGSVLGSGQSALTTTADDDAGGDAQASVAPSELQSGWIRALAHRLTSSARASTTFRPATWIAVLGDQPLLVAAAPVAAVANSTNSADGAAAAPAPAAFFVAVRVWSESDAQRLAARMGTAVNLLPWPTDRASAETDFIATAPDGRIAGCVALIDAERKPTALLRAEHRSQLRENARYILGVVAVVLALGAILLCVLIDRLILRRLISRFGHISEELHAIQRSGDFSQRLAIAGTDELTSLTHEANRLLASVESSHRALERANAEMQQRVAERTAALGDANAALESDIAERIKAEQERERLREQLLQAHKMEAVGTLAGGIAHDFNNILTGILGHAQLLSGEVAPNSPGETNLKQVIAAAERATALVRQILAFSRQSPGERRLISAGQVAREALALLRAALPSGIAIRFQADSREDSVNADPTQLHQVLMNLGVNGGQAMGSKGGELTVKIERTRLRTVHRQLAPGDYLRISVRDTGCGMTQEVMDRIFDPFFSTKPVNEGTGLGLAVVHGIVIDHGGAIDVESEIGVGTCFRVWLPAADAPAPAPVTRSSPPIAGNERVLLVDDEEIVLSVLTKGLQRLGYAVTAASTGGAALAIFRENPESFDLVITDQTMPQMSGLQLNAALKAIRPDLPVILATGYSPEVADRDPASLGLAAVLSKPIHFTELTRSMRVALDEAEARAAVGV